MSLQLPGALVWVLDLLGFTWPAADEDKLREAARAWRDFAHDANNIRTTAAGVISKVAQGNYGKDIDALVAYWQELGGDGGHLPDAAEAARLAADALDGFAVATEVAKCAMIAQLAICAGEIAAAQAAAPITFGLSELGALGATQASRIAIRRIVKEKIEDVVQHELAHKLRTVLKEVFEKILRAARHKVDDLKQYVDDAAGRLGGPQLAHATTGGPSRVPGGTPHPRPSGGSYRRSEHAELRRAQGRRVGPAFNDAAQARQADVFIQPDGRYVVRGPRGREHIFEPNGEHVTTLDRPRKAHEGKVTRGQRQRVTDEEFSKFKELFE